MQMLLQAERDRRNENKIARLMKNAKFRYEASIEEVAFDSARGKDKDRIMQLSTCDYIKAGTSVLISSPTGVGKCFLATAIGHQACLHGFKVRYYNMQKLNEAINKARIESNVSKFFDKIADIDLLIIDYFGLVKLSGQQLIDFMEIIEDRHGRKSTIIVRCQTKVHNCKCSYLCCNIILLFSEILLLIEFCFIISLIFLIFSPCPKYTSLGVRLSNDS